MMFIRIPSEQPPRFEVLSEPLKDARSGLFEQSSNDQLDSATWEIMIHDNF